MKLVDETGARGNMFDVGNVSGEEEIPQKGQSSLSYNTNRGQSLNHDMLVLFASDDT